MSPFQFIAHNGRQIFLIDFITAKTTAAITQTVEEIKKTLTLQLSQSIIALLFVTGTHIEREISISQ